MGGGQGSSHPELHQRHGHLARLRQAGRAETRHHLEGFVQRAKLDLGPLQEAGIELLFLEDVRARITGTQRILALLRQYAQARPVNSVTINCQLTTTAVVLFTSGSEGDPKGVELTHRNLLANIRQMLVGRST